MDLSVKPADSCKGAVASVSSSGALGALWVAVVAQSLSWWSPREGLGAARAWLRLALAWLSGIERVEALCGAAERAREGSPWPIGWAVRAATCALLIELREAGRWPAWRAIPYALSLRVHPLSLGYEVLEAAAWSSGRSVEDAREAWSAMCARAGVVA